MSCWSICFFVIVCLWVVLNIIIVGNVEVEDKEWRWGFVLVMYVGCIFKGENIIMMLFLILIIEGVRYIVIIDV